MADLDLPALDEWRRLEVARHVEQTRHLRYGGPERMDALLYRVPFGDPAVADDSPPAVFLPVLAAAVRSGAARVKAPHMDKADLIEVSDLLQVCVNRASKEARDQGVTDSLAQLRRDWDQRHRLPADELDRAEHLAVDAARREAESARRENARLKRSRVA